METTLQINDSTQAPRPKFFARQFASAPTLSQRKFDWTFGVLLPIVCIAADPIVFRNWGGDAIDVLFPRYQIFSYILSSVSIMAMAAWLLWGKKLGELRPFLGGFFLVAAMAIFGAWANEQTAADRRRMDAATKARQSTS